MRRSVILRVASIILTLSLIVPILTTSVPVAAQEPPPTPTNPRPGSTSPPGPVLSSKTVTLEWDASPGTIFYMLWVYDANTETVELVGVATGTSYTATLQPNTPYWWVVNAQSSAGTSPRTNPRYFRTSPAKADLVLSMYPVYDAVWGGISLNNIEVENRGDIPADNVRLVLTLDSGIECWDASGDYTYDPSDHSVTLDLGSTEAGSGCYPWVGLYYEPLYQELGFVEISGSLSTTTPEYNYLNNEDQQGYLVFPPVQFMLLKHAPASTGQGSELTYSIEYSNLIYGLWWDGMTENVVLLDTLPAEVEFISASNGGTHADGQVTWEFGSSEDLADGEVTVTVKAADDVPIGTTIHNEAEIWGSPGIPSDPYSYADVVTTVIEAPDLPPDTEITGGPIGEIHYKDVTFTWTGSDDVSPVSDLVYSYCLAGYDDDWSAWTTDTSTDYTDLPNGGYIFYVKAKDQAGNIDPTPALQVFIVDWKLSFAIITDLHIGINDPNNDYGDSTWDDADSEETGLPAPVNNLRKIVQIINANEIDFVVVLGDITDSAELSEFNAAIGELNKLKVPWIPIIGNHDVWPYYGANPDITDPLAEMAPEIGPNNAGTDRYFYNIFAAYHEELSGVFSNWEKATVPVWNPQVAPAHNSFFQNFAFDYEGYHFIALDFNARDNAPWPWKGIAPEGDLHAFSGGTWNWFKDHLKGYVSEHPESSENIILLAHHPFNTYDDYLGTLAAGFSDYELIIMRDFLIDYKDNVYIEFGGHRHPDQVQHYSWLEGIMQTVEIPANFEDPLALMIHIYQDGQTECWEYSVLGSDIITKSHCPVDSIITDPDGLICSKSVNQIAGASYIEMDEDGDGSLDDVVYITNKKLGDYQIRVIVEPFASPTDAYSLEVCTLDDPFGYVSIPLAENVVIAEIPSEPYHFESKEKKPTSLSYTGDVSGLYAGSINLSARLTDEEGNPVPGKPITFEIGTQIVSATTDEDGLAVTTLTLNQTPSPYYFVQTSFSGDDDHLPAFDSRTFEIQTALDFEIFTFGDANVNGQPDPGEEGLGGWHFEVTGPGGYRWTGSTSPTGSISFETLAEGVYTVTETLKQGWYNTTPLVQKASVEPGTSVRLNFGNREELRDIPTMVPSMNRCGTIIMMALFAGLLLWTMRRRRLTS